MNPETILQIIRLSLELAIRIHDSIPKEQHASFWEAHQARMAFWQGLFEKLANKSAGP
jgi:hypothetical protein